MADTTDALRALETWLGTFADDIPAEAYHRLCAIQRSLATPAGSASGDGMCYCQEGVTCPACEIADGGPYNGIDWQATCETLQAEVAQLRGQVSERHCQVINSDAQVAEQRERAETAEAEAARLREDAARLDWLERAGDVYFGIVVDAPHDGEYSLHHDLAGQPAFGPTLRAAIDAAMGSANGQG